MDTTVYTVIEVMQSGPWIRLYYAPAWLNWHNRGAKLDAKTLRTRATQLSRPVLGMNFRITAERPEDVDIEEA